MKFSRKYSLLFLMFLISLCTYAQDPREHGNLPTYYKARLHFGFTLGVNRGNFLLRPSEHFELFDTLKAVEAQPKFGFNLGIVSELMLHKYVTLRFVPNLSFVERHLVYYFEGHDTIARKKTIESTFLNFPLDLKLRSKRVNNFGAYILAGGSYSLDLASKRKVVNEGTDISEQIVKLKRDDFGYEMGAGAEFYLEYFKFAIEGKLIIGTRNMIVKDNTIFSNSIERLNSKIFLISITFEG